MSLLNAYRDVVSNPYAGSGEATEQNRQRAAAIEEKSKPKGLLGAFEDTLAEQPAPQAAPSPASVRPQAIPTDTKQQQLGDYKATEFAEDFGRKVAGAAVGGTLSAPQGVEEGVKGTVRRQISGESYMIPQAQWADKAMGWLMDATGFRSYAEQASDREKALIAFDRFASGVKIPGTAGLAKYGREVQADIESEISEEGKKRLEGSSPTGNIFKGELDFGSNPTVSGYALQAAGVFGSLAPTVATALITRSPTAAMAVGGSQAAGEGAQNARDYIGNLSDKQLAEVSPYYNTLIENGVPAEEARTIVTDKAAETSAVLQGMVAAVGSRVTSKLLTGAYDDILARVGRNRVGAAAARVGFAATEEGIQETAEGVASDVGIRSQISDKEIGENSAANLVLGALGGAPVGAIQGARNTPESALSSYLDRAVKGTTAAPGSVERAAVRALDPNRDVALDPQDVRPADGQRAAPIVGVNGTAVPATADAPEALPQGEQAQNLSQPDSSATTVDQILNQSGADLLDELDAQEAAQATAVQQPVVDPTFTSAVEGIKTDLGLDATENLNLGLVTDNTRLNRFKNALETSFGVKVHFVDFGEQLTTDSGKQLGAFTGYRQGDTILIGANGVDLIDTTWHELTHVLETRHSDVYAQLRDTLVPAMDATVRDQLISSLNARRQAEVGRDLSQQELDSELVAYVVGDLVRSPETMGQMFDSFSDPVAAKTFRDVVMDALQKMLAVIKGPQYIRERARLVEAQKSVTAAFAEFQKRETQKRMAAPAQAAAQPAPVLKSAPALTPASVANSALMTKSIADFVRGKPAKTRKLSGGETLVSLPLATINGIGFSPDIILPSGKDATVENVAAQALVQLRAEYDKEGRAFPTDPAQMSRDEFALAYEAGAIPEFEIDGEEIGTVVEDRGDGFRVNVDKLYDKVQKQNETQKKMAGGVTATDANAADQNTNFARRVKPEPAQTVKAYKLFRVDPKQPGKLFPLFVNANDPVDMGVWLDAESGPAATGGKVKSKIGSLAYRPGWHAGDLPIATHIGSKSNPALKKPDLRPDNHVWAEVELAADRDWQSEANRRGTNAQGQVVPVRAQINDQLPEDGFYRYKTNPNMTGNWLIGGSMKVNRILPDTEVEQINRASGTADLRREKPFNPERYGLRGNTTPAPTNTAAAPAQAPAQTGAAPTTAVAQPGQFARRTKLQIATRLSEGKPVTDNEMARNPEIAAVRDGVRELIKRAAAVKAKFDVRAKRLAKKHGMQLLAGPIKSEHRAFGKAWFDKRGDFRGLNDIVRSTFVVKDLNDIPAMVDVVLAEFPGSRVRRNGWVNPGDVGETGYRDVFFENVTFDGFRVELQMNLQPMMDAKQSQGHKLYEEETNLTRQLDNPGLSAEQRAEIQAKRADNIARQNAVYSKGYQAVLAATKSLNSASDTRLPSESTRDAETGRGGPTPDVEGPSQAMNPSSGDRETGMPSTLKNDVPSGNDLGNDIVRTPAIPDGNIAQQQAEQNRYRLGIRRAARMTDAEAGLSPDELTALQTDATKKGVPDDVLRRLVGDAVAAKRRFPVAQGWASMFVRGVTVPEGATPADAELSWTPITYKYNVPDGLGRAPQKLNEAWADKVSDEFYKLIKDVYGRAIAGDRNANVILSHKNWYRNVTEVLRREFGATGDLLADLLGATSPNTPVDTNWQFSIDILRRFVRGDFNEDMKKFAQYVADGGRVSDYPSEEKIRQISGKLYGMNSSNAMLALLNTWRQIHPGQAPKARNFALNLIGQSNMATIDVWAARMLRRAANIAAGGNAMARIPPPAEKGVTGDWNSKATAVTGEFGFGARVMDIVVERLRAEGIDVTAPDLQAIAWFTEKELWSKNNWTSAQGEGGSFEENIEGMPMERYLAGWSIQQGEAVPEAGASSLAQARVMTALKMDGSVIAARVMPTKGLYGGTVEQSFDTEWTVEKGKHDPSLVLAEISQIAKDNSQYDIFVSKVLKPEEASENARPGVEIYFRDQQALDAAMPVLERFTSQGVDGFTMAVDPRAEGGSYIGVRLQYIPEISMRWDEEFRASALSGDFLSNTMADKTSQLDRIVADVSTMDGVAFAKTYQYDTIVVGKENYDAYIDRAAAREDKAAGSTSWFGQPIRSAVERAAARLNRDAGQVDAGRVQDASRPEPGSVGQFSRQLVELAANQDPRAPKLFGISETPTVLRAVGGPRQLLVIEPRTVAKVVNPQFTGRVTEEGGMRRNAAGLMVPAAARIPLTVDELRSVPAMIADPVAVIRSDGGTMTRRYGYKVILDMVKNGNPVVAIVHPDVRYGNDKASEIASVYPVNEGNSLTETNRELNSAQLLYFNKGKATVLASKIGNKLPSITKITPPLAKNPGSVPDRALPPIRNSNFSRRVAIPGQNFTLPARTLRDKYLENLFENRMSRVEDVQQAVEQQGGTLDIRDAQGNVVGSTDISSASQRMRGAVRGRLDRFKKEVEIPLIEDAAKAGVNLEEVAQYLYAVYAPERNAIIQQRNPTQFATDGGSGMTNAEAAQIVGTFRARRDFAEIERIARRFQNITRMTQNILLDEGLVEPQIIAQWKRDNPNYVPLRGFENVDEETGNPLGVGSPGRLDPRNPFVKVAKGRETKAGQIIENILKDYTDAVVLAEKNKVNKLFLQFVRDNPDPALWQINAPKVSRSYYKGGMTPLGYVQGTVRVAFEVNEDPSETIAVRINGRPVFIRVKDAAMLDDMQMAGAIGSGDQAKLYFRVMSGMMQTLAKLRTTLSPAFVFIDALRNTETGGFWNLVKYGPKTAAKAYARLFKAARIAWKAERDGTWQGNTDTITIREPGQVPRTITLKEAYDMYRADGGKVGYLDIKEIEDIQKDIQQRFRAAQAAGSLDPRTYGTQMLGVVNKVEDLMLDAAGSVETAMRFATYMARLEAGANRQQATDAAKNVTVNFDRKGKWTPHLGLLYMFANANIQGTRATYNLIFKSGKAGALLGGSLIGLGYAVAQLAAGASGDDDEPYWDKKLYKQSKIKNLVFFTAEGDTVTIPMAYGSGFFVNLGYALSDLQRGVPLAKVGAFMRDSFFTHFSPFGSLENPLTFATPTMLDPLAVIVGNQTEQGIPLMPDSSFEPNKPDSEKFWTATRGTMFQQLSRAMNDATGGTQGKSGFIDVSPETLRYGVGFLTGGAGGFVRDAADSILLTTEIGLDSALEKNKIPILRSFYQQNTGKQNQSEFYENADEAVRALDEWKVLYGTEKIREEPTRDRLRESRRVIALGAAVDEYKKALAAFRYQEVAIVDRRTSGDFTAAEAEERLARIAERKNKLYVQFNRAFYKADPNTPD